MLKTIHWQVDRSASYSVSFETQGFSLVFLVRTDKIVEEVIGGVRCFFGVFVSEPVFTKRGHILQYLSVSIQYA